MPITQKELSSQNPWWENPKNIEVDPKITEFGESKIKWTPGIIKDISNAKPYSFFVIRGPRQVGKTTAIKLIIRDLLKIHNPHGIFFFDCEALYQARELEETLDAYFRFLDLIKWKGNYFIFLDEITSIPGWSKVIKFLIDRGQFKRGIITISGSNAMDLKKGADRLPGRKGSGGEIAFLPLSFREYLEVSHSEFHNQIAKHLAHGSNTEITSLWQRSQELYPYLNTLNRYIEEYLLCGGFPRLINEYNKNSTISYKTYEDYLSWIRGEIAKQKRDEKRGLQILAELSTVLSSKLGWDAIANKIGGLSHHTVEDYINICELLFMGKILYQIDIAKKRINWRKNKKFYFIDNLLYFLVRGVAEKWNDYFNRGLEILSTPEQKSKLLEQLIFNHLTRIYTDWMEPNVVFWSNSQEIDFILREERDFLPIEVKWQKHTAQKNFLPMVNLNFRKGIILSQNTLERHNNFLIIPTSIFVSIL